MVLRLLSSEAFLYTHVESHEERLIDFCFRVLLCEPLSEVFHEVLCCLFGSMPVRSDFAMREAPFFREVCELR